MKLTRFKIIFQFVVDEIRRRFFMVKWGATLIYLREVILISSFGHFVKWVC